MFIPVYVACILLIKSNINDSYYYFASHHNTYINCAANLSSKDQFFALKY